MPPPCGVEFSRLLLQPAVLRSNEDASPCGVESSRSLLQPAVLRSNEDATPLRGGVFTFAATTGSLKEQ